MPKKMIVKIIAFLFVVSLMLYINYVHIDLHPERIQLTILSFGIWAPLIFIAIFSLRPFVLFPASILGVVGGLSFGPIIGPIVTYVGSVSGAIISFLAVRYLGRNIRRKKWTGRGETIQKKIEEKGFFYVFALRVIPVINFDLVSYLSALSRISFKKYIFATMIGIIPGTLAFNFLGASFVELSPLMFIITGTMFVVAFLVPLIIKKILKKKKNIDLDFLSDKET
ncbi:TVP38/TMEM64 family protein [Salipaludibacillus sp. HK11]|uniref:TVP38/TMEM64 family protein n=1 Tax=Salipaludibacillus sp. HK11 TaxID=3394320 RepID=UPI0039FDA9F0